MAEMEIINPVNDATINGKIKASEDLNGFFISIIITKKNELVAKVDDEYNSLSLYCRFSNANGGVFFEIQSQIICISM
ncbi:hypothetical protein B4901_00800 [Yersinia frederiksenii]|nr:hypothetical protein B4901_00800 [Yersinia frederiksenii]